MSLVERNFIKKILSYDLEDIDIPKRRSEVSKVLSLLLIFFVKHKAKLVEFKLIPKTKQFLLLHIGLNSEPKIL